MRRILVLTLAALLALPLGAALAQGREAPAPGRGDTAERKVRQAFARRVQQVLGASDEQMRRLAPINRRFENERRALLLEERGVRGELRQALRGATPDEAKVGQLLDRLFASQRRRLELVEEEQRELSAVLTPTQRARYLVLQQEVRRRVEGMRDQRGKRGRTRP